MATFEIRNQTPPGNAVLSQSGPIVLTALNVDLDGVYEAGGVTLDLGTHVYFRGREIVLAQFSPASVDREHWETAALTLSYDPPTKKLRVFDVGGPPGRSPLLELETGEDLTGIRASGLVVSLAGGGF